jgi:hypothetical protein
MANFGTDVSRTLDAVFRQFNQIVWRNGKPPIDSEMNLTGQVDWENLREEIKSLMPSGFISDPTRPMDDFQFNENWSNMFVLGNPAIRIVGGQLVYIEKNPVVWANVNGWLVPVAGTDLDPLTWGGGEPANIIRLNPPPGTDARVDFVFLEVWQARVDANPATANKPSKDKIWKYGNTKFGLTNLPDDLEDPTIGYDTTARIQIQYRIRVYGSGVGQGSGADLVNYPDGLGNPLIVGQGAATAPVQGYAFINMREELGDTSLWRAGDGSSGAMQSLGTIDGYSWAIPICAVFRRDSASYVAVSESGSPNHSGGFCRTPGTVRLPDPLTGARVLTIPTLKDGFDAQDGFDPGSAYPAGPVQVGFPYGRPVAFSFYVDNLRGSGIDDTSHNWDGAFLVIDGEILSVSAVDVTNQKITVPAGGRARFGTDVSAHAAGAVISFFNTRPDGLYSDQIASSDILDLRRFVNAQDWDFGRILEHNVGSLLAGKLHTAWKKGGASVSQGVSVHEVDQLWAGGATHPVQTEPVDGPDGVRTIWSDAAAIQPDITSLLDNEAPTVTPGPITIDTFDATVQWDVSPGFNPRGFLNTAGLATATSFSNGSVLLFHIGGADGTEGARGTFRDGSTRAVRFLMPKEAWKSGYPVVDARNGNQHPISIRFNGERAFEHVPEGLGTARTARHVGPMYPWKDLSFEYPFIALGGILTPGPIGSLGAPMRYSRPVTNFQAHTATSDPAIFNKLVEFNVGIDFDTVGQWYSLDDSGDMANDPSAVAEPVLRSLRTLYGLLTDNGRYRTGLSSELYVVLYGDTVFRHNNGAFQVVGAGTAGYTINSGAASGNLVLRPLSADFDTFNAATGATVAIEFRTPEHNSEDRSDAGADFADLAIVFTDIGGQLAMDTPTPWNPPVVVSGMQIVSPDHPWLRDKLGAGTNYDLSIQDTVGDGTGTAFVDNKAIVSLSLLYHPGRGAETRIPDNFCRFALKGSNTSPGAYLRQNPASIDTTFAATSGMPSNETFWDAVHVQLWNRLSSLGWNAGGDPSGGTGTSQPNWGGNLVGWTEIDRESELFFDRGSKTVVFRPFRDREMTLKTMPLMTNTVPRPWPPVYIASAFAANHCLMGPYTYPTATAGTAKDSLELYTFMAGGGSTAATNGKVTAYVVPTEYMPRFGRQDIPFYVDLSQGAGPFLPGINHLFLDTTNVNADVFNIIGGETSNSEIKTLLVVASSGTSTHGPANYGKDSTITKEENELPCYVGRKTTDIDPARTYAPEVIANLAAVNSSDFGKGLKGIQLPPYLGPARILGVFDRSDFTTRAGRTFEANRWQMVDDCCPNLLRVDGDKQTLYILQDGAKDLTQESDDHTYIIPESAIDISKALSWTGTGDTFEAHNYVVELEAFGFAKGFINQNNFVLIRHYNGHGGENFDGQSVELPNIHMILPAPAKANDAFYVAANRTPYQGDPYFTRQDGTHTAVWSDWAARYGQITTHDESVLMTPSQQYDPYGVFVPEITNPRVFEVLASMDFYTTMGTGKIGGALSPGTPLDVGFRGLDEGVQPPWPWKYPKSDPWPECRFVPRAFTEGQKDNPSRAGMEVFARDNTRWNPDDKTFIRIRFGLLDDTWVNLYGSTDANRADLFTWLTDPTGGGLTATEAAQAIFRVDSTSATVFYDRGSTHSTVSVPYGGTVDMTVSVPGAVVGDAAIINNRIVPSNPSVFCTGWVSAADTVTVRWIHVLDSPFTWPLASGNNNLLRDLAIADTHVLANNSAAVTPTLTFTGAATGDTVLIEDLTGTNHNIIFTGRVTAADTVTVWAHNISTGALDTGTRTLRIGVFRNQTFTAVTVNDPDIKVAHRTGSMTHTIANLVTKINNHADLYKSVKAFTPGDDSFSVVSVPVGSEGDGIQLAVDMFYLTGATAPDQSAQQLVYMRSAIPSNDHPMPFVSTARSELVGGIDVMVNAGNGISQIGLTGMTERLPLGAILQDFEFLCENPLGDDASAVKTGPAGPRPVQTVMPMAAAGEEFDRFTGEPGLTVALSDGYTCITDFTPYNADTAPDGIRQFRIFRGGGATYMVGGPNPGGPLDWVADTFPAASHPVLKGSVLACRAMLVRNFPEQVEEGDNIRTVSEGDEIQMVILTYGIRGSAVSYQGFSLDGIIGPSGYGEAWAAADRYRVDGHPMFRGFGRQAPDPLVQLAVYPDNN